MGKYTMTKSRNRYKKKEDEYVERVKSDPEKVNDYSDSEILAQLLGYSLPITSQVAKLRDTVNYVKDWQKNTGMSAKNIKYPSRLFNQSGTLNSLVSDAVSLFGGQFSKLKRMV